MNHFAFVATETIDWTAKFLVYVKASSVKSAYAKLESAGYEDWRLTDRPSAYCHLTVDELGYSAE